MIITDEMVAAACEVYERVYIDEDKTLAEAMAAAIRAALAYAETHTFHAMTDALADEANQS
jgi:hypothetical protein